MLVNINTIIIVIAISMVVTILAYIIYIYQKKSSYDQANHKAILEEVRNSFEKQMYLLNDRLMKNEERWRDVNHLLLRKEYLDDKPIVLNKKVILNDFLISNGITTNDLILDKELIFVLTPFNSAFIKEYDVIRNICAEVGFKCVRGDETYFSSDIFPEMLKQIVKANLIIANLNGRNPNVLYELGIAQALDKSVILISKNPENLPIDIKSKRFLVYNDLSELDLHLKNELIKILKSQLADKDRLSQNKHNIIIHSAKYSAAGNSIDVTLKVKEFVSHNQLEFLVTNELLGGDPYVGEQKQLEIDYSIDGIPKKLIALERAMVRLV